MDECKTLIVGFTLLTQRIQPTELVAMLHALFAAMDGICEKHNVEKIETIGDAYLAATGRGLHSSIFSSI